MMKIVKLMLKKTIIYIIYNFAFVATCASASTTLNWENITTLASPKPIRGEFSFVKDDSGHNIYLYGGCDITFSVFYNDLWVLRLNRKTDSNKAQSPLQTMGG